MRKTLFIIIGSILTISAVAIGIKSVSTNTVYINMASVYEQFQLSKELNKELEIVFKTRKHILDSLYQHLKVMNNDIQNLKEDRKTAIENFKKLEEEYLYKQKTFEAENQSAVKKNDEQIWQRINQGTEKYGKAEDYDYILGANGQGNIMYGKDKKNVTKDLIDFLNADYNGTAK